ncbi:hypothetical protein DWX59_00965 [Enterocloster aldenensis]|uniref:hypothetical protein n=1 Tax=Dorea formicigenerans TaxID=39486 RepID=UPI000E4284B4|nr:hypothetical protein [Dorea formicigenerans]RGC30105.1 hypothetical protein DWX59_00965 [Enterocloster aldenensis]RJW36023.1 hypothetical protein DXC97_20545 [Lachnospiraceae bacterium TF09-5]
MTGCKRIWLWGKCRHDRSAPTGTIRRERTSGQERLAGKRQMKLVDTKGNPGDGCPFTPGQKPQKE